jgi:hypothetical protein
MNELPLGRVAVARLLQTPQGNVWVVPLFLSLAARAHYQVRKPYWVTGPKCPPHGAGPELTYEEIEHHFGPEARRWAEEDDRLGAEGVGPPPGEVTS